MKKEASRLIVAASESSADLLFATGFFAPDAFAFLESRQGRRILVNDLEIDRARRQAKVDVVDSLSAVEGKLRGTGGKRPPYVSLLVEWLRQNRVKAVRVPGDFPLGLADGLRASGLKVRPVEGHFWPEREFKSPSELRAITSALRLTEVGMAR